MRMNVFILPVVFRLKKSKDLLKLIQQTPEKEMIVFKTSEN